jgi:AcrR family transcriptional regulator
MTVTRDAIVDAALARAEQTSWEAVRLHDIAAALGTTLNEVRAHFREKEEIVDAWFDRADSAMLAHAARPDEAARSTRERLEGAMLAWLDALFAHRHVTRQMILGKLEPGHVHYQVKGVMRVSRTVQWMREAAGRDAVLPWRAIEETVLTGIYVMTFFHWMYDGSPGSVRTREFLRRRLDRAGRLARAMPGAPV